MKAKWFSTILVLAMLIATFIPSANAAPAAQDDGPIFAGVGYDNIKHPLGDKQAALKARAKDAQLHGKTDGNVYEVERGQYVELGKEATADRVFVILAQFGGSIAPAYGGTPGPLHNRIPEPDRTVDNNTIWQADYNKAHYEDIYFNQMVDYYNAQSSGEYTIDGAVHTWVKVPFNEARYGSDKCGSHVCSTVWYLIRDAINQWVADRKADGMSKQEIHDYLATFDVTDRYDADGDGIFGEPDGYIDHFQIVHAGVGQETGGGAQGDDAIWSHRWYTAYQGQGSWGPAGSELGGMEFGGSGQFANLGGGVDVWVGDYTMQPENGGLGVFAHEYAHDLGLPDQYDTFGGENSTGFWTLMSSGSYLGDGTLDIGSRPGDFNAWEKFQLGWLNYGLIYTSGEYDLGKAETALQPEKQGYFVFLPYKKVTEVLANPFAGSHLYYSGSGDDLNNSMTRSVTLPAGAVSFSAWTNFSIELDWDYAYLTVNGTPVATNLSSASNPHGQNFGEGITGSTGGNWVNLTANLSAYAGQTVEIGFRYWTDGAVAEKGFMVDNIQITGLPLDGAESDFGWTYHGFWVSTGVEVNYYSNYYVLENRQYFNYDDGLRTGPYNFGFLNTKPEWVEHYPYQDGMLVSYWDNSYGDNNTSAHPGGGLILPIDSHPAALMRPDGTPWRARVQAYDSTFNLGSTDAVTLHVNGDASVIPSKSGAKLFDDNKQYWNPVTPLAGVMNPNTGTQIQIMSSAGGVMHLKAMLPDINIKGKGVDIAMGDYTPSATDGTDFGPADLNGGKVTHTFTVENTGTGNLYLPNVEIIGGNAADFTVLTSPANPLAANSSTTFKIQFNPLAPGLRTATVVVNNSSVFAQEYYFDIQGTAATENLMNYVKNGGFNNYPVMSNIPVFWTVANFRSHDGKTTSVKQEGAASVKIFGANFAKTMTQSVGIPGEANDYVTFSFWVKGVTIPVGGACQIMVTFYDGAAPVLTKGTPCPTGTFAFTQKTFKFNVPVDYTSATVRVVYQKTGGVIWLDAMTLVR